MGSGLSITRGSWATRHGLAVAAVGLALALELVTWPLFEPAPFMLFYAAVTLAAWYGGWRAGAFATVLAVAASLYFLLPPRFTLRIPTAGTGLLLIGFMLVCGIICLLTERLRVSTRRLERALDELREERSDLAHANEELQVQTEEMMAQTEEALTQADELLEAERELRRQLGYTAAITDGMDEGLCALDAEGCITFLNPAGERMLGSAPGALVGREMHSAVHYRRPDGTAYPIDECPLRFARDLGNTIRGEEWFVRCDGSLVPVVFSTSPLHVEGRVAGQVIAFSDLTERRNAESALRVSAERLNLALEAGRMGTWDWDPATGVIAWSTGLEAMFGLAPGSFDGTFESFVNLIHPEDRDAVARGIGESAERGTDHHVRHRVARPDGTVVWVEGRGKVFRDGDGHVTRMVGVTIDVTERENAARTIQEMNASLEREVQDRTAALQETIAELESFSYSVSHDLRAPIRAMRGFADAILDDSERQPGSDPTDHARRIAEAAEHMDLLISDLLAYSRLSRTAIHAEPVSLIAVVDEVLARMAPEIAERRAVIQLDLDPQLPLAMGHRTVLFQIVSNLVANAIKFVPDDARPRVRIGGERVDGVVKLWVQDNGIGIEPHHQERIFRVFERLHPASRYPGTGVGLAIARKGVERLAGRIDVESRTGEGSRFWIELPAAS